MFLSRKAYHRIKEQVCILNNLYETGGVLIGYRFLFFYYIIDVTVDDNVSAHSKTSFTLDGVQHTEKVKELMKQYIFKPIILGLWHSHICYDTQFSQQDKASNTSFATSLKRNILSMLVVLYDNRLKIATYEITPYGKKKLLSKKENKL